MTSKTGAIEIESSGAMRFRDHRGAPVAQYSLGKSILLHLFPGAATTAFYLAIMPIIRHAGFPPMMALLIAGMTVLVPLELGHLLWHAKKNTGGYALRSVVRFGEAWPFWRSAGMVALTAVSAVILVTLVTPIDHWWTHSVFPWLPHWYIFSDLSQYAHYSRRILIITFSVRLVADGFVMPVVEELYFRGYLLPRLTWLGRYAPWMNCALFSFYHFWQPYNLPTLFAVSLPIVFVVWKTRNLRFGIWTHALLNTVGAILALVVVLKS